MVWLSKMAVLKILTLQTLSLLTIFKKMLPLPPFMVHVVQIGVILVTTQKKVRKEELL